jgi:hypothetical protein
MDENDSSPTGPDLHVYQRDSLPLSTRSLHLANDISDRRWSGEQPVHTVRARLHHTRSITSYMHAYMPF